MPTYTPFEDHPENIPDEIEAPDAGKALGCIDDKDKQFVDESFEKLAQLIQEFEEDFPDGQ